MNNNNYFNVQNEIVVITGVSGQLGIQYAKTFLNLGAIVIGLDLKLSEDIATIEKKFIDKFHFYCCDITNKEQLLVVHEQCLKKIGIPTVLVNNAAIDSPPGSSAKENGPFEHYTEESWNKVMIVNVSAVFLMCQIFGTSMAKNKKGSIINVSSIYGIVSPDQSLYEYKKKNGIEFYKPIAYSVSKSALINLTKYLAVYWAKDNVRVNTLIIAGVFNNQDKEFLNLYENRIPVGRMANYDEYNGGVVFLASNASKYMTGSELKIDGGWTAI
jgi:NAD(P)-dependent dehydrogenase (short-subunit alcohol dehydrogenase family)